MRKGRRLTSRMLAEARETPNCVARQLGADQAAYRDFGAALRQRPTPSMLTLARGSSDHAAHFMAYLIMARHCGRRRRAPKAASCRSSKPARLNLIRSARSSVSICWCNRWRARLRPGSPAASDESDKDVVTAARHAWTALGQCTQRACRQLVHKRFPLGTTASCFYLSFTYSEVRIFPTCQRGYSWGCGIK